MRRALICLAVAWTLWVGVAVTIAWHDTTQTDAIYVIEPDAGPGIFPASSDCDIDVSDDPLTVKPQHNYDYRGDDFRYGSIA